MDFVFGAAPPSNSARHKQSSNTAVNNASSRGANSTYSSLTSRGRNAIMQESSVALDFILGIRHGIKAKKLPMEIELKTIEPRTARLHTSESAATFSRSHSRSSFSGLNSRSSISGVSDFPGSSSQHSVNSLLSAGGSEIDEGEHLGGAAAAGGGGVVGARGIFNRITWQSRSAIALTMRACRLVLSGPEDDAFYEQIRIQPFATGAYLRGMLVAGFASLFFNLYCISMWPEFNMLYGAGGLEFRPHHPLAERCMYAMLLMQLFFNALQLPVRISLHLKCWESSRSVEVDVAINLIRAMLQSDAWLINRALGRVLDLLSIITLVMGDVYLCWLPSQDPLHQLVVSLCSTNLLALFVRLVMATVFALSMHDPQVLSDARRRGLSKWDLEVLPAFVFTSLKEVTNPECSICLAAFDAGEMLISLPCDNKHSFHANCIRQWLERQNSCPLCQKLI